MNEINIKQQLEINKHRQVIIDALLILHEYSDLIETIKTLSSDAKIELVERFKINPLQASAIMEIKKPLAQIPLEKILEEKSNLKEIELRLNTIES